MNRYVGRGLPPLLVAALTVVSGALIGGCSYPAAAGDSTNPDSPGATTQPEDERVAIESSERVIEKAVAGLSSPVRTPGPSSTPDAAKTLRTFVERNLPGGHPLAHVTIVDVRPVEVWLGIHPRTTMGLCLTATPAPPNGSLGTSRRFEVFLEVDGRNGTWRLSSIGRDVKPC